MVARYGPSKSPGSTHRSQGSLSTVNLKPSLQSIFFSVAVVPSHGGHAWSFLRAWTPLASSLSEKIEMVYTVA